MPPASDRLLFLDWDGTLSTGRFWSSLNRVDYEKIQNVFFTLENGLAREWMLGKQSSADICLWLSQRIGLGRDFLFEALIADCEAMGIDHGIRDLLDMLSIRTKLVLTTDNMDCFSRYTVPANDLDKIFHEIINSSDIGRMKKDQRGKTYLDAAMRQGIPIKNCILIDDSKSTCDLFSALGGTAHQTKNPQNTFEILKNLTDV